MIVSRPLAGNSQATAACAETDAIGDLVYVSGSMQDGDLAVNRADIKQFNKMPSVAIIVSKLSPTRCVVQTGGEVKGVYSNLSPGKVYFAGQTGRPVVDPPVPPPGQYLYLQPIGIALGEDVLSLRPQLNLTMLRG